MKNMVLLIDANVLLNYLLNRGVECRALGAGFFQ